nr:hypothetical protein [Bordetella pertussis]
MYDACLRQHGALRVDTRPAPWRRYCPPSCRPPTRST